MWDSFKKKFSGGTSAEHKTDKSEQKEQKEHKPFNLDLSTRSGFKAAQPLTTQVDALKLQKYEADVDKMPMPPVLWEQFQRATREGASNKKIATIITSDPVLSAYKIKVVNSPAFGLLKPIVSLDRALAHLGSTTTRSIIAKYCFSNIFPQKDNVYNVEALWKHGMAVAALAEVVSQHIPKCNAETASSIGLFHDIGRMGFNFFKTEHEVAMFDEDEGYLVFEAERFGCTHVEMGDLFAKHWALPDEIRQGMLWHHHPGSVHADAVPQSIRAEVFAVYIADLLAKHLEFPGGNNSKTLPHESYASLLPKTNLYDIMHEQAVSKELWRVNCIDF